jgi:hypothetical protein
MNWGDSRPNTPVWGVWRALCAALIGALCLFTAPSASAQYVATEQSTASAVIIAPLQLLKREDMTFGRVVVGTAAGTVVINPLTDTCTYSATVVSGGGCHAAQFVGMGNKKMRFRLTLPNSITLTGPGAPMTVDTFMAGFNASVTPPSGNGNGPQRFTIESDSGIFDFKVGATLRVNANQLGGIYTGTFDVTVMYN